MKTAIAKTIKQKSLNYSAIKQQFLNPHNSASNESRLEISDETEFELERIMCEEFTQGLPSDIDIGL